MPQYFPEDFEGTFWTVTDGAYYVSTVGNDITGNGSPQDPFLTVSKAFELAQDGEKIVIGPDEYIGFDAVAFDSSGADFPCRLATTAHISIESGGLMTIDGVLTKEGDRVLVWNQNGPAQNGIYIASSNTWLRDENYNNEENVIPGKLIPVSEGISNANSVFQLTIDEDILIDSTFLSYNKISLEADWGDIGGTIDNQTDLSDSLNLKADKSNVLELDNANAFVPTADYHPSTKKFVEDQIAVLDKATPKGLLDASTNPDYPAGVVGDYYYISIAGKVGGTSGDDVQLGDKLQCIADNNGGDQTAVGTSWIIFQGNLDKASATDAQTGTDDEKYLTPAKGYEGWNSWVNNKVVNELNTTSKTIIGAINELESSGSTLVDGNGTSVNGGAVDLGGSLSIDVTIDGVSNYDFRVVNTSEFVVYPTTVVQLFGPDVYTGRTQLAFTDVFSGVVIENNLGFKIRDFRNEGSRKGFEYYADYSDDFVDRSLVDKAYVDAAVSSGSGSLFVDGNGTVVNGTSIGLGGILDSDVLITGNTSGNGIDFSLTDIVEFGIDCDRFDFNAGTALFLDTSGGGHFQLSDNSSNEVLELYYGTVANRVGLVSFGDVSTEDFYQISLLASGTDVPAEFRAVINKTSDKSYLLLNSDDFQIDVGNPTNGSRFRDKRSGSAAVGFEYASDYSSNFTDRSLVDKAYVDAAISSSSSPVSTSFSVQLRFHKHLTQVQVLRLDATKVYNDTLDGVSGATYRTSDDDGASWTIRSSISDVNTYLSGLVADPWLEVMVESVDNNIGFVVIEEI